MRPPLAALPLILALPLLAADPFTFAILGDRTGEARPGVFEQIYKEAVAEHPAFILTTGDTIEGGDDRTAEPQWKSVQSVWQRYPIPLYLVPGNHDIWSALSERLFRQYSGHPLHYSFDHENAHFTVLDDSRSDALSHEELDFLERDLKAHAAAPVKMIVSHRPAWILNVAMRNPDFSLHRLARQYGVQYVIAGHVHQMLRLELEGVTYISLPSSAGHLRLSSAYRDGWFYGHARVEIAGSEIHFRIEEARAPNGQGRVTDLSDWGMAGLIRK